MILINYHKIIDWYNLRLIIHIVINHSEEINYESNFQTSMCQLLLGSYSTEIVCDTCIANFEE